MEDWVNILMSWLLFFALLFSFLFPAYKFRVLARKHQRKGWIYFVVGLIVTGVGFSCVRLIFYCLKYFFEPKDLDFHWSITFTIFIPVFIFYRIVYKYIKSEFEKEII